MIKNDFHTHRQKLTTINYRYKRKIKESFEQEAVREEVKRTSAQIITQRQYCCFTLIKAMGFSLSRVVPNVEMHKGFFQTFCSVSNNQIKIKADLARIEIQWNRERHNEDTSAYPRRLIEQCCWRNGVEPIFAEWCVENPQLIEPLVMEIDYANRF